MLVGVAQEPLKLMLVDVDEELLLKLMLVDVGEELLKFPKLSLLEMMVLIVLLETVLENV